MCTAPSHFGSKLGQYTDGVYHSDSRSVPAKAWEESREAYTARLKRVCEDVGERILNTTAAEVKPSSRQVHSRLYFPSWWHVTSGFPGHQRHIGRGGPLPGLPTSDQQASRERGRKAATLGCQAPLPNRGSRGVPRGFRRCSRGVPGLLKGFRAHSAPFFAGAPVVELRPYIILKKENRPANRRAKQTRRQTRAF